MSRKRKTNNASHSSPVKKEGLENKIIENLIELQKVHTNLAEKFDKLSNQIASLLTLFEMSARSFAEQPANQAIQKDKEFLDKIDKLLEQNKTIAKGLSLMEERIRERVYGSKSEEQNHDSFQPSIGNAERPLPRF